MNLALVPKIMNTRFLLLLALVVFEFFHIKVLFGDAEYLAGGDNYVYLQLETSKIYPYFWNNLLHPFGSINFAMPDTLGLQFYSVLFDFLSGPAAQRVILYALYLLRYLAFYKLIKYISPKISIFALVPAVIVYALNAFSTLDPFSLFPLLNAVYLPLSLYYFLKLYDSENFDLITIFKLLVLSIVFSSLNSNIPLAVTVFVPQLIYVLFNFKKLNRNRLKNVLAYYILWLVFNLWWLFPLAKYFSTSASTVFNANWFSAVGVGNTFMNLRFLGQWAWYTKHFLYNYYPFSAYYDNFIVVIVTYFIVALALLTPVRKISVNLVKYRLYFFVLAILGLLFVGGSRLPFGFIYRFLYENIFGFKIFREPFTKFELIYVLAISVLLYISLFYIERLFNKKTKAAVFSALMLFCFISTKPVIFGEHVWTKWNGNMRTFRIQIPDYWREFKEYLVNNSISGERIITFPKVNYGTAWNWPRGFTSADDVAVSFVGPYNFVVRNTLVSTGGSSGTIIDSIYSGRSVQQSFLGFLGIKYVLVENDLDWRYTGRGTLPPTENLTQIEKLGVRKIKDFGKFDAEYLKSIPNDTPFSSDKKKLYSELENKPALSLYEINRDLITPLIYSPAKVIYSSGDASRLSEIYNTEHFGSDTVFLLSQYDASKRAYRNNDLVRVSDKYILYPNGIDPLFFPGRVAWEPGWFWPEVNVSPASLEHKFVMLGEKLELLRSSELEKLDKYIWFSSKRIEELRKYSLELSTEQKEKLITDYIFKFNKAFDITDSLPFDRNNETYIGLLKKLTRYLERSYAYLATTDFDMSEDPRLNRLKARYTDLISKVMGDNCGEYCFDFRVPKDGEYTLYVNNKEIEKRDLRIDDGEYTQLDPKLFLENMELGEWKDFGITSKFAEIKNWNSSQTYKIAFDYRTNVPKTSLSIVEEITADAKSTTIERKSSIEEDLHVFEINPINNDSLEGTRYCSFVEGGDCYSHYEKIFTSRKDIQNAILVFDFGTVENTVKNLIIQKVNNFDVNLVSDNSLISELKLPKITFQKINPTRYEVLVEDVNSDFLLVFNQNYDGNWNLFEQDNLLVNTDVNGSEVKNYPNFNVAEQPLKDVFWETDFLNTFFKEPLEGSSHFVANGYANGWYIKPSAGAEKLSFVIEYSNQRVFYILLIVNVSVLLLLVGMCAVKLYKKRKHK